MVYGWMPTVLELYPEVDSLSLQAGADLVQRARRTGVISERDLGALAGLVNNSVVGASKLLHFCNPAQFAIWDSKVFAFINEATKIKPYHHRVNSPAAYSDYLQTLRGIVARPGFAAFQQAVIAKVGYPVSPLRAIELVMFKNTPAVAG